MKNGPGKRHERNRQRALILASGSPYRRQLLERLGIAFEVVVPNVDESATHANDGAELAATLAMLKARAVAAIHPQAVVIGSDQVAECEGRQLGKPGTIERAIAQLEFTSGREVVFHTAVAMISGQHEHSRQQSPQQSRRVTTRVVMKTLSPEQIRAYVEADRPLDCAGAMKSESLGIALTRSISCNDPTALIGLPLIAVTDMLGSLGIHLPANMQQSPRPK